MENGKTRKISLVPMQRKENLADLLLMFSGPLQMRPKGFHWYSFIKLSRNDAFRHFFVNCILAIETPAVKVCTISFERPPERLQSQCNYRPFIT